MMRLSGVIAMIVVVLSHAAFAVREIAPDEVLQQADALKNDDPHKPALIYRAAFLYEQRYRQARLQLAQTNDAKQRATWEKGAKDALAGAEKTYHRIVDEAAFANYKDMDEVLASLAQLLTEAGRAADAEPYWTRLIKDYPQSKWTPPALVALGDRYFEAADLKTAAAYYDRVITFGASPMRPYARYKRGWVDFNNQKYQDAFVAWTSVASETAGDVRNEQLRKEALNDATRAYAEFGDPKKARATFTKLDPKGDPTPLLEKLAGHWMDAGQWASAIVIWRDLLSASPKHADACQWRDGLVTALRSSKAAETEVNKVQQEAKTAGCT
jgi:tetratricopeptide (TPR) repeat protein